MDWFEVSNAADVPSPALLIYSERVEENIRRMVRIAGDPRRLRPHVKTHKLPELVELQKKYGVNKFKAATVAEAEMTAKCGASEVLIAFQPVGPAAKRMARLVEEFPETRFGTIVDDAAVLARLSESLPGKSELDILLDVDCGMGRTGVIPGEKAIEVYRAISRFGNLRPAGLHVYDGQIHMSDLGERRQQAEMAFEMAVKLREDLEAAGLLVPTMILGGTPTFAIHAERAGIELSPGTCVFWDWGYSSKFPDLDFAIAAAVLTRVASKPGMNRLCLDLGHKAIASENPQPRAMFPQLPEATPVIHSEEHLVLETPRAAEFVVGDVFYALPRHICPTVALHEHAYVVQNGVASERWRVTARARQLTI